MKQILSDIKAAVRKTAVIVVTAMTALGAVSCGHNDEPEPEPPVSRTVLVYMVAGNDLGRDGWEKADLQEMIKGLAAGATDQGGTLLIYRNAYGSEHDCLIRMLTDGTEETLVTYDDDDLCAVDADRLTRVLSDARRYAPADGYGLIFWSHGTGWIEEQTSRSDIAPLSFGLDNRRRMKITSLADALRPYPSEWIYFDCCHMGTAEIIYELRDAAPLIVASTTELPLEGMPYDRNLPVFFSPEPSLAIAAANTYEYYRDTPGVSSNSCSIAVYNTSAMAELASATAAILATGATLPADYRPIDYTRSSLSGTIFDMRDYIMALDASDALRRAWDAAYTKAVEYHASTRTCYGIDMSNFTGLGCYIVTGPNDVTRGYANYGWYTDVVARQPALSNQ